MDLNALMRAGIDAAPADEAGALLLSGTVTSAAKAADNAAAGVAAAKELEAERIERKQRWQQRAANRLTEANSQQVKKISQLLALSSKTSIEELSAAHVQTAADIAVIGRVVSAVEGQIADARRKIHAAEIALLIAQREWCLAAGIQAAHAAHMAILPILAAEPNTVLDFSDSKVSKYSVMLADLDGKLSTMQNQGVN